jgi:hypothetical protein
VIGLDTVKVEPQIVPNLPELLSYFKFSVPVDEYGCEGYLLKIWDGGLYYHYAFPGGSGVPPISGTQLGANYTYNNWGGVNATDALAIQYMATQVDISQQPYNYNWLGAMTLSPRFGYYSHSIADVNSSNPYMNGGITALDALTTNYRSVGLMDVFPHANANIQYSPNFRVTGRMVPELPHMTWHEAFDYDNPDDVPFVHSGASYLYFTSALDHMYTSTPLPRISDRNYINIYYTALGDINSSYVPTSDGFKITSADDLVYEGKRFVTKGDIVEIPVRISEATELGAITLGLSYRSDLLEILGVDYEINYIDHEAATIRMAWADLAPVYLGSNDTIAMVRARVLDDIKPDTRYFRLESITELADAYARVLDNYALKTDALTTETLKAELFITNYPNPFNHATNLSYYLPEHGKVKLEVYNNMGQIIETLVDDDQQAGTYQVQFKPNTIITGTYFYRIVLETENGQYKGTGKMIFMP